APEGRAVRARAAEDAQRESAAPRHSGEVPRARRSGRPDLVGEPSGGRRDRPGSLSRRAVETVGAAALDERGAAASGGWRRGAFALACLVNFVAWTAGYVLLGTLALYAAGLGVPEAQ